MNSTNFDRNAYWIERGKGYIDEMRLQDEFYKRQERTILSHVLIRRPRRILELGCGFGRITRRIAQACPAPIMAYDLSSDQIENARPYCGAEWVTFRQGDLTDLQVLNELPPADLAIAIELFLHLSPEDLERLIPCVLERCPVLIHDFDINPDPRPGAHVVNHDYAALYERLGVCFEREVRDDIGLIIAHAA